MTAQVFWAIFYSSRRPRQIGSTVDFNGAAIPPPIFSMFWTNWIAQECVVPLWTTVCSTDIVLLNCWANEDQTWYAIMLVSNQIIKQKNKQSKKMFYLNCTRVWVRWCHYGLRYVVLILFFSIVGQMKTRHDMPLCRGQSTRKIIPIMFLDIVEEKRGHAYYARYSNK